MGRHSFRTPNVSTELARLFNVRWTTALDLAIDGKMEQEALKAVEKAFDDLEAKLKGAPIVYDPRNQRLYSDAKSQLDVLRKYRAIVHGHQIQPVFADIDNYSGTTVDELRLFMRRPRLELRQRGYT